MFALINGKPVFYIGKVNDIGYTDEQDKKIIIKKLKEDNSDIEIKDEKLEIDEGLKRQAIELGNLQLTYSKSEFMKYLKGEKYVPEIKVLELEQVNKLNAMALMELNRKILTMGGGK